jgi:hypothetical protein
VALKIVRQSQLPERFGVGATKFRTDFQFHDSSDPFVPDTDPPVCRLRLFAIGARAQGALEHEVDALIEALAKQPARAVQTNFRGRRGAAG